MNETHFVSAGGNLIVKPKSARILVNRKCSSEDELFVLLSPKATSSPRSLLNKEINQGESRRRSTIDANHSPVPPESRRYSRRISDSTNWEKTPAKQTSGNELSKSDQGAAGRRRVARDKLANSDSTPKQVPTDGLSKSNHDRPRSKKEVLSNSNHDDKKRGHSRPRSRRDVLSTIVDWRRSDQSPANLLSDSGSHSSAPVSGHSQMINQQLQHLQEQVQLLQQQQQQRQQQEQQEQQHSQHQPQQQPQEDQEGGRPRSKRNMLSNSGHSRNKSHSSGAPRSRSNPTRRRRVRDDCSKISDHNSSTSSPPTTERLSTSDHGGRRTRRHNNLGASGDPKTTPPIKSKCMKIKVQSARENQPIADFSINDEKKWDLGKSWGFESFAEAEAEAETIWSRIA